MTAPHGPNRAASDAPAVPGSTRPWLVWMAAAVWAAAVMPLCFWGLPSRANDDLLFGGTPTWDAARFDADAAIRELRDRQAGADTDADPVGERASLLDLTPDDAARAAILLRYRLYSHQPDEMITFRALQRMKPRQGDFDPKLYQYGGAYIYGVGGAVGAASLVGAARLTRDLNHYLDHPADFGRFYFIARLISVAFGAIGLVACFRIAARTGRAGPGWLAMALVGLSPVFLSGAVEAKPHIPSACMALLAIERALVFLDRRTLRDAIILGIAAGLSAGLVLTGVAAWFLIPAAWLAAGQDRRAATRPLLVAAAIAVAVYALTNPYVVVNLLAAPESLRSNIGNSTAMYSISRFGEGALRVADLLHQAMGGWMLVVGLTGCLLAAAKWRARLIIPAAPAVAMLLLCAAIGAGKPAEFARFLALPAAVLGCAAGVCLRRFSETRLGLAATVGMLGLWSIGVGGYVSAFWADGWGGGSTRRLAGEWLAARIAPGEVVGVFQEPAPYSIPPLDFATRRVLLLPPSPPPAISEGNTTQPSEPQWVVITVDGPSDLRRYRAWMDRYEVAKRTSLDLPTPITWANKPVIILRRRP